MGVASCSMFSCLIGEARIEFKSVKTGTKPPSDCNRSRIRPPSLTGIGPDSILCCTSVAYISVQGARREHSGKPFRRLPIFRSRRKHKTNQQQTSMIFTSAFYLSNGPGLIFLASQLDIIHLLEIDTLPQIFREKYLVTFQVQAESYHWRDQQQSKEM